MNSREAIFLIYQGFFGFSHGAFPFADDPGPQYCPLSCSFALC
jgi:hypothetical protein